MCNRVLLTLLLVGLGLGWRRSAPLERGVFVTVALALLFTVSRVSHSGALGLLPTTSSRVLQNLFYSLDDTKYPAKVAVWRVVTSGLVGALAMVALDRYRVLDLGLLEGADQSGDALRLGAVGLALGSVVGAWLEATMLFAEGRRRIDRVRVPAAPLVRPRLARAAEGARR